MLAYGLVHRFGRWYLLGPEQGDDVVKAFRRDRMQSVAVGEDPGAFDRPQDFDAASVLSDIGPDVADGVARIRFDSDVVAVALQRSPDARIVEERAESSVVELPLVESRAMISWLLTFDDRAVIEEPEDLRSAFLDHLGVSP